MPDPLDPEAIFATLDRHRVRYVLIGGLAAALYGSTVATQDADICPERSAENLDQLASALRDMNARIRTTAVPEGLPFRCDGQFLEQMQMVNLTTDFGDFDISFRPAAFTGYDDLLEHAVEFDIDGIIVPVASLRDVIRSKEAAGRVKDHAMLPYLYALEDEIAELEAERARRESDE